VFEDLDGNGDQDIFSGEMGIEGWGLELWWNGQVIATTSTGPDGSFVFPDLGNSIYSVCAEVRAPYTQTPSRGQVPVQECGRVGYTFTFSGSIMMWSINNFGEQMLP